MVVVDADILEKLKADWTFNQARYYLPYGHPATLSKGAVCQAKMRVPKDFHFLVDIAYHHDNQLVWDALANMQGNDGWCEWSDKPWQWDFHEAGKDCQERMSMAANRPGKTRSAAMEVSYHLTGDYPEWWEGKRFTKPVLAWTGSPTTETSRDIVQKELLGGLAKEQLGSGSVPRDSISGKPKTRQAGVSDVIDKFRVRHVSGGISECVLKTYEQGWRKWQGTAPDIVWLDEEPDDAEERQRRIYSEALTRLLTSHGSMMVTFTPLLGQTELVGHYQGGGPGVFLTTATWDDAPHLNLTERSRIAASYPDHERQARTQGVPMMGEGRAFGVDEEEIKVPRFEIPDHFARIKGIDFGIDHFAAAVDIAIDRDKDVIYVTRVWRKRNVTDVSEHCAAITHNTPWIPVAWPHDGANREKGGASGVQLKTKYVEKGVRMLGRSACYKNDRLGAQPRDPIVLEINDRCVSGGFKVFADCVEFFDEYRNYHRKNGKLIDRNDDVLKATFYAVMMRRCAMTRPYGGPKRTHTPQPLSMAR